MKRQEKETPAAVIVDGRRLAYAILKALDKEAHVYVDADGLDSYVVSEKPLSPRQVKHFCRGQEMKWAREALKSGSHPADVYGTYRVSAADISRIAKEEGITLPYRWFAELRQELDAEKRIAQTKVAAA